jgi:hypothetical protein
MEPTIEKRQQEIAKNPGFEIVEHALGLTAPVGKRTAASERK